MAKFIMLKVDEESFEVKFFTKGETPPLFAPDHIKAVEAYYNGINLPLTDENKKGF